jgi:iron only hydrogenase large subunit-like protein
MHTKGALAKKEMIVLDGINDLIKFLDKPNKKIKFIDTTFCIGGCIGGPFVNKTRSLKERTKRVVDYMKQAKKNKIPESRKGIIEKAKGINFEARY